MDAVLTEARFEDFGPDLLYPFPRSGMCCVEGATAEQLKDQVRKYVPRVPGVYGMVDLLGRLIYVGKSKALRNRLLSYFLPGNEEDKSGRIVQSTGMLVWETQPSEFAALIREQALIRQFLPRFNVQGIPRRQQAVYVCVGRPPAEQLYVSRRSEPQALHVLGPLQGAARAYRAVEVLNRHFRLRDCSTRQACSFSEQLQLFEIELRPGCIRLEIGSCLGPCISACSKKQYDRQVQQAIDFLSGKDTNAVDQIEDSMFQLALARQFEQAAVVREDLRAIKWLGQRAADVANARQRYSFVYSVRDATVNKQRHIWYLVRHGVIEGALAAPNNAAELRSAREALRQWWKQPAWLGKSFNPRPETLALVASWFRNHRGELGQTLALTQHGDLASPSLQKLGSTVCAS